MKVTALILFVMALTSFGYDSFAQTSSSTRNLPAKNLYIDVHQLQPGKVKFADVANAHAKDLAVQKKYGVDFIKFWVDEEKGLVYCV